MNSDQTLTLPWEGVPVEQHTDSSIIMCPPTSLLDPGSDEHLNLAGVLRKYGIRNEKGENFWTDKVLTDILTEHRVRSELQRFPRVASDLVQLYVKNICGITPGKGLGSYAKVFSILILLEKGDQFGNFFDERLCDAELPLQAVNVVNPKLFSNGNPNKPFASFDTWPVHERDYFSHIQWQLLIPYFKADTKETAILHELPEKTILPWCKLDEIDHQIYESYHGGQGVDGMVSLVQIHHTAHEFEHVLRDFKMDGRIFAVKELKTTDMAEKDKRLFHKELRHLKSFNGYAHKHLVTLLYGFYMGTRYYFVFPAAKCHLGQLWGEDEIMDMSQFLDPKYDPNLDPAIKPSIEHATLPWNLDAVRWASTQLMGLMGALSTIHNPRHLNLHQTVPKYGRHGDIKSDNILCFNPEDISNYQRLILSDFGLSALNSDKSRSNIPRDKVPPIPGYRPPECDVEGGTISRDFDVWTMGCLYVEFITWLLGGNHSRAKFKCARVTQSFTGSKNDMFFRLLKSGNSDVAQVKPEVTIWMNKLRETENASQFILDVLDIIEKDMMIILSENRRRCSSTELLTKFGQIQSECKNADYCLNKVPNPRLSPVSTGVEVHLTSIASTAHEKGPKAIYQGKFKKRMSFKEYQAIGAETLNLQ